MALAVCLLFDRPGERRVRALWSRLAELGIQTLAAHTHGRHVPHLSYVVLREWELDRVRTAVERLPDEGPFELYVDAVGVFRRGRTWLAPALGPDVARRQLAVLEAVRSTGADVHRNYETGVWTPHLTVAPRVPLESLPLLVATINDVLPLRLRVDRAALVDSGTGVVYPLATIP